LMQARATASDSMTVLFPPALPVADNYVMFDLLPITRDAVVLPDPSYSLKVVERRAGYRRTLDEYGGDWSIARYIEAVETDDESARDQIMQEILDYNREDLEATWAVMGWLRSLA
jgi:predicted RecB family nuclease